MVCANYVGAVRVGAGRVQRGDRGRALGLPEPAHRLADADRLHQCGRRGRGRRGPAAARPLRVLAAGVPRDRRGPRLLLAEAKQLPEHTKTALLLGTHQPRRRQYR